MDTAILPLDNVKDTEEEVVMAETNTTVESKAAAAVEGCNNTEASQPPIAENDVTKTSPSSDKGVSTVFHSF